MKSFFSAFAYAVKKIDTRIDRWIRSWNPYDPAHLQERGLHPIAVEESQIRRRAARCFFVGMIVFLLWAFLAPIDSGVDVSGSMVVAGYRKSVQPSTGGVVEEIRVKEGDFVKQGDVLIKINPLNTEASLVNATLQYINLLVTESRLKSERLGKSIISWSPSLNRWEHDPRVQEAKALQIDLLKSRRSEHANQLAGLHAQVDGLLSSIAARKVQLVTLDEELASNEKLSAEGFVPKNATNAALRTKLEAQAILANTMADLGRVRAQIAQQKTAYERDIEHELSETQKNREAFQSRFEAAKFDRIQTEISAPVSGQVVGLKVFTVGGVIQPGAVLMEIVPDGGTLIAEVEVPTHLIDKVHEGLNADIRFVAFNQTTTPIISGRVKLVGADKQTPASSGKNEFYLAHVEIAKDGLALLGKLKVQPGMPVDVLIKTGERSFVSYMLKPITDKFAKAFKN